MKKWINGRKKMLSNDMISNEFGAVCVFSTSVLITIRRMRGEEGMQIYNPILVHFKFETEEESDQKKNK